ncbi:MAG: methyltransferase domain-containing protein [Anaerolineae bacterium]|jgi:SAM-dependent methyltransferase|nr:methyltransferase domain-containing protein [Anaerolineae bacterium]
MSWWETYFGDLYLRLFATKVTPEGTDQEVAGVLALLDPRPGARILDLGCGQGRHAVILARLGYSVAGLDRSAVLLGRAREAAREATDKAAWVLGDMRFLPFGQEFDACVSLFTSFGYFDEAENEGVLRQICGILRPGGALFLDLPNRDRQAHGGELRPASSQRYGEATILEETHFDPVTSRCTTTYTWLEDGRAESITHSVRHYAAPEITAMLRRADLEPLALYGDVDGSPYTAGSKRLIVVARKGGGDDGRR